VSLAFLQVYQFVVLVQGLKLSDLVGCGKGQPHYFPHSLYCFPWGPLIFNSQDLGYAGSQ
jgi:hypothetical protein